MIHKSGLIKTWLGVIILILLSVFIYNNRFVTPDQIDADLKVNEPTSYISCGCGCCGFNGDINEIAKETCLYRTKGESVKDKIDQDKNLTPNMCATVGCSYPIKYIYCD